MVLVGPIEEAAFQALQSYTGSIVARSIVNGAKASCGISGEMINAGDLAALLRAIEGGARAFLADTNKADECVTATRASVSRITGVSLDDVGSMNPVGSAGNAGFSAQPAGTRPFAAASASASPGFGAAPFGAAPAAVDIPARRIDILQEFDIVTARGETKNMCMELGFPALEQVKIATVVSELARNIVQYAETGYIDLRPVAVPKRGIEITATDNGTGIPDIDHVLSGEYNSKTGMGVGLVGTKRLMDEFSVDTGPTGTRILAKRYIP